LICLELLPIDVVVFSRLQLVRQSIIVSQQAFDERPGVLEPVVPYEYSDIDLVLQFPREHFASFAREEALIKDFVELVVIFVGGLEFGYSIEKILVDRDIGASRPYS
jgi:hypothetical protein